jgi:hypothetical protein
MGFGGGVHVERPVHSPGVIIRHLRPKGEPHSREKPRRSAGPSIVWLGDEWLGNLAAFEVVPRISSAHAASRCDEVRELLVLIFDIGENGFRICAAATVRPD